MSLLIPVRIESRILTLRGVRVMIDADLAELYGVQTRRLNEQVKRNASRFPPDFIFQLNASEKVEVVANCDHLSMVRAFVQLRQAAVTHADLAQRLTDLEMKVEGMEIKTDAFAHNTRNQLRQIFEALRALTQPPDPPKRPIGFVLPADKT